MPEDEENEPQPKKLKKNLQCFSQMDESTLGCHNFGGFKFLFKVLF
jgi:hypothetical protein